MLWIDWPAVVSDCDVVAQRFLALDCARVTGPANRLEIVDVIKQIEVAFVSGPVVYDSAARVRST